MEKVQVGACKVEEGLSIAEVAYFVGASSFFRVVLVGVLVEGHILAVLEVSVLPFAWQ